MASNSGDDTQYEKSLDELLADEEKKGKAREARPRSQTKIPGVGRGVSEKWFLLLWMAVLGTGIAGYILTRREEGGQFVIDNPYEWWVWAIVIAGAAVLGLIAQVLYVVIFVAGKRKRIAQKKAPAPASEPESDDV